MVCFFLLNSRDETMSGGFDDHKSSSGSNNSSKSSSPTISFELKKRKGEHQGVSGSDDEGSPFPKKRKRQNLHSISLLASEAVSQLVNTIASDDIEDYHDTVLPPVAPVAQVPQLPEIQNKKSASDDDDTKKRATSNESFFTATMSVDDTDEVKDTKKRKLATFRRRKKSNITDLAQSLLLKIKQDIKTESELDEDLEISIANSNMPYEYKKKAIKILMKAGVDSARGGAGGGNPTSSDYQRAIKFTSDLLSIPWGKYAEIPISLNGSGNNAAVRKYVANQIRKLNQQVYGMTSVKQELIEYLIAKISNPMSCGDVIGLVGDPGVGKTMIAKFIADFLSTKLYTINLGGQKDSHILKGHGRLYVDSIFGEISHAVIDTQVLNPCIRIDEPDKISETYSKDILGVLTHALDPETNDKWLDDYFSGFPIDLSRVTWIISYNDPEVINKDLPVGSRMRIIKVPNYTTDDKIRICKDYILPGYLKQFNIPREDIKISDDVVRYILETFSPHEKGVRNAKRTMQSLVRKIQLLNIIGLKDDPDDEDETGSDNDNRVIEAIVNFKDIHKPSFPLEITRELIGKLFANYKDDTDNSIPSMMYL